MSKTFTIEAKEPIESLLERAKATAARHSATLTGDAKKGTFAGSGVKGTYETEGSTIHITITDKPMIAPMSMVESKIREFFK
jgi:hypothetical protein